MATVSPPPSPPGATPPTRGPLPPPPARARPPRPKAGRLIAVGALIAVVVILLLLGVGGFVFLGNRAGSTNNIIGTASPKTSPKASPKSSPAASPSPTTALKPVPTYAPAASAPITKVQLCLPAATCVGGTSADTNCTLGGSCRLDFGIYWTGQGAVSTLAYSVKFFDRCSGSEQVVFNRTDTDSRISRQISWIPAPPGGFAATLPTGAKAAAIVAVVTTDKGVSAASAPYDLPGSAASCT